MRIYQDGQDAIFYDPTLENKNVFQILYPGFQIEGEFPREGFNPKFQKLKSKGIDLEQALFELDMDRLEAVIHAQEKNSGKEHIFSAFDVLQTLCLNTLSECRMCGHLCGVNRYQESGLCNLKNTTFNSELEVLIAEEHPINPSLTTRFSGCGMSCVYCPEFALWEPGSQPKTDPKLFWEIAKTQMGKTRINGIEFVNATESIHGVLELLSHAPKEFSLPVILNIHLFGSEIFYKIANRITDVFLFDLRYGNNDCAQRLSKISDYLTYVKIGLDAAVNSDARIIVRLLVLPGHVECCHKAAIKILEKYRERIWVSVLDQFIPEHEAANYPELNRRPTRQEIESVKTLAQEHGLRDIENSNNDFWS